MTTINVGCDDGYAATKLAIRDPSAPGEFTLMSIPSRARQGIHGISSVGKPQGMCSQYVSDDMSFTVGDFPDSENARFTDYPFSAMNRIVIHHTLRLAGLAGRDVNLATGLPPLAYFKGTVPNEAVISRKDESVRRNVAAMDGSDMAGIVGHSVYPECLAAWIDYVIDNNGTETDRIDACTGIVDIGGRTTDIAVVMPGSEIDHARMNTVDIGVLDVIEHVATSLFNQHGTRSIPHGRIEQALATGEIVLWGKKHDITEQVQGAINASLEKIAREIDRCIGTAVDIDTLLVVGGGAHLFGGICNRFPNAHIPDSPEFANARGFAKYMEV